LHDLWPGRKPGWEANVILQWPNSPFCHPTNFQLTVDCCFYHPATESAPDIAPVRFCTKNWSRMHSRSLATIITSTMSTQTMKSTWPFFDWSIGRPRVSRYAANLMKQSDCLNVSKQLCTTLSERMGMLIIIITHRLVGCA
jgi:hypothetical protein